MNFQKYGYPKKDFERLGKRTGTFKRTLDYNTQKGNVGSEISLCTTFNNLSKPLATILKKHNIL